MFCDYVLLKIVIVKCLKLTFVKIKQSAMKRTFLALFGSIGIDFNVGVMRKG